IADSHGETVSRFITDWLSPPQDTDWVNAWICHVGESRPGLVDARLATALERLVTNQGTGVLTRMVGVRVLAASSRLTSTLWINTMKLLPQPAVSELSLIVLNEPTRYPFINSMTELS